MKYCIYCGAKLSEGSKFCSRCGNSVYELPPQQKSNFEEISYSTLELKSETEPTKVEQRVQNEEYAAEDVVTEKVVTDDVATHDDTPKDDGCEEEKSGGISTFAIVLCSIALLLVMAFVVFKVVQNSKPKYRIVYKAQTIQTTPQKTEALKQNNDLAKKANNKKNSNEQVPKSNKTPFITGLSQYKMYGASGGSYEFEADNRIWNVSLSLKKYYMNCIISDGWGNADSIPLVDSDCVEDDFTPENNQYIIGQYDFDNNGINEVIIGLFNSIEGYDFLEIAVYRVSDGSSWRFDCSVEQGGCTKIDKNVIRVMQDCRKIVYQYVFEDDDFVEYYDM